MPTSVQITSVGLDIMRDALIGAQSNAAITWIAFGTGTNAPTAGDTQLQTEVFRKAVTSNVPGANPGESLTTLYLSPQDIPGTTIQEVGWFAGPTASSSPNSGVMVARVLYNHAHTNQESIQSVLDSTI